MAQVAACIRFMLSLAQQSSAAATTTPWHTEWLTEIGFPLVADGFHRGPHPLVHQYSARIARATDETLLLVPFLRFPYWRRLRT